MVQDVNGDAFQAKRKAGWEAKIVSKHPQAHLSEGTFR